MRDFLIQSDNIQKSTFSANHYLGDSDRLFVLYLLGDILHRVTLTEGRSSVQTPDLKVVLQGEDVTVNSQPLPTGYSQVGDLPVFLVSVQEATTFFFLIDPSEPFVLGPDPVARIKTKEGATLVLTGQSLSLDPGQLFAYYNETRVGNHLFIPDFQVGDQILTPDFLLERRLTQWKLTTWRQDMVFDTHYFLKQDADLEFPPNFPDYRRSPRLNLEPPEDKIQIQKIGPAAQPNKNSLLKAILPPVGMLAMTGLVSVLSGRSPLMLLGMGMMSLMTAGFTMSQYWSEKRERTNQDQIRRDNYESYLLKTVSGLSRLWETEAQVLHYKHPSPAELSLLIHRYDSRIYERMSHHKDYLEVSLGTGSQPSTLTVTSDVTERETDPDSLRVRALTTRFSSQRGVPISLNLSGQTLGLVGTYPVLRTAVSQLWLQLAFFHSYREVNLIALVPDQAYPKDWEAWRLSPHFKIQELGIRGLVHNSQTREMVLNSFYQLLNRRKQIVQESGRETPRFSPHYVVTILEDSYLSGHGINEFLAEDMSELGVTVIWCKEDQKLLPETVSALVHYRSPDAGQLINDHHLYVAKDFAPYSEAEDLEPTLRRLANLVHVEVEKNAIPDSLSLLDQYEVTTVEALGIKDRWQSAEPNKSIRSLIGWRGKVDPVYWDLHERVHGPHALVGGTTGSGKSEFLTTYLIGLAINFSPEDIGMLIIDWKGGGIANTLARLPHFMGSITNLDGAGTARALASIKAELDKRMKIFAFYGVNSINAYMSLYKASHEGRSDITYPDQPIPHLILVSDEFAELKAHVPEFLDELTSVARIGRSLGVHLILATQKPSGVVNDQIEANSRSKIALKMASEQDSNELLKTPDAAHLTQPGRGYLRVGQNEVYDLFQSGYAGVPYDPDATQGEVVDERVYIINDLGQEVLVYDPGEAVIQRKGMSDLPSQLEAVITEISTVFEGSGLRLPDKPWLPNLGTRLPSPPVGAEVETRVTTEIPLGLLDIPSDQVQTSYMYDLQKASHTVIFSSPGFGKSTTLQTIVMNLARQNTPEQVQFNLFDLGTNGLLPLKNLPHVADIVTLEENEKLQKMLHRLEQNLAERKALFKKEGVANLSQYQAKTKEELPILVNVLDSYDGLSQNDNRKDNIDNLLMKVLREGAAVGIYLVITAGRYNAIRMNMMANIQTKMALFLNEDGDLSNLFGRDKLEQVELPGRAQIRLDQPLALQIYLPIGGENEVEVLARLEEEIIAISESWSGSLPDEIPMVPDELTPETYAAIINKEKDLMPLGLNKLSAQAEFFNLFNAKSLGIFPASAKQFKHVMPFLMEQLFESIENEEVILIDASKNMEQYASKVSVYISKESIIEQNMNLQKAVQAWLSEESDTPRLLIMNGLADLVTQLNIQQGQLTSLLTQNNPNKQLIVADYFTRVGNSFNMPTTVVRENAYQVLFGGDLNNQHLIENLPAEAKKEIFNKNVLHAVKDEEFFNIVIPVESEEG